MAVTWHEHLIDNPRRASAEAVRETEQEFGVTFPADYLAVATVHQGARPEPESITLPDGTGTGFGRLLHFEDAPPHTNIISRRWVVQDWLPERVVPFADSSGDLWCFDFRADPANPTVVYYAHDDPNESLPVVASSFTDLINKLC